MKRKDILLIGCGRIGFLLENDPLRNKPCTHAGGALSAGLTITHAVDLSPQRLEAFRRKYRLSGENCYTDYREALKKTAPRLVIIATWTESHADIAIAAARAGTPVIVLEKPIAPSLFDARRLLRACEKYGTALVINHERRYDPRYRKVKSLIEADKIGTLKSINGSILTGPYRGPSRISEGGGPLLHDGTHLVDIISFFGGKFTRVSGNFSREERKTGYEDRATAWLKTERGIDVFIEAGGSREFFQFEVILSGTKGKITIGNGYQFLYTATASRLYKGFRDLKEANFPSIPEGNCFTSLYREVKKLMLGKDIAIASSGLDGYEALQTVHAVYLSSYRDGKMVKLPLGERSVNLKKIFEIHD